jgi:hypothetical protein
MHWLMKVVGISPVHAGFETSCDQVLHRDSPHVIEFLFPGPSSQGMGGRVREDSDGWAARDHQPDGAAPVRVVQVGGDAAAKIAEFFDDVLRQNDTFALVPAT